MPGTTRSHTMQWNMRSSINRHSSINWQSLCECSHTRWLGTLSGGHSTPVTPTHTALPLALIATSCTMAGWQSSCKCSHTWWWVHAQFTQPFTATYSLPWPSPSSCAGGLPQRSDTALALGSGGHSERQAEQQSHHPEGEHAKLDCDTNHFGS